MIFLGMLGMMWLDTPKSNNRNGDVYDKDFFKENLNGNYYDNFMLDEVTSQMKDNFIKQEFDYLRRNGLSVERAVDKLVRDRKIKF